MKLEFTNFVSAVSRSTDFVEAEILSISQYHEKRVAVMVNAMGKAMGMDEETVYALTMAGALHDCTLSENLHDDYSDYDLAELNLAEHCLSGEQMLLYFPLYSKVRGAVLHHHDRADGSGALGMTAEQTPIYGQMIHIADRVDARLGLLTMDREKHQKILEWLDEERDKWFSDQMCNLFAQAVDYDLLQSIAGEGVKRVLRELVQPVVIDVPMPVMRRISTSFAHITDYKSHFTWRHSLGVAEKAERMGQLYGYDRELCDKLYIAGALHDIGKLLISNDILEKPGKLTREEYREIQNHAMGTWKLLCNIGGMEDICRWASLHHEKLDGSGYPFGLKGDELGKHERLMACLDIYQALVEERPYKEGMSHSEAMAILRKMGAAGQLDEDIIRDIDRCHALHCETVASKRRHKEETRRYYAEAWRCPVCGYVYEGALPNDYICPRCEQPGSIFERADCLKV
jgi:HD-GYP domain-containing protein (c-di-GMP phosphodiesterase class II)/rubredoxin